MIRVCLPLFALGLVASCVTMDEVRTHIRTEAEKTVLERASFDLQCDREKLTAMELGAAVYEQKYARHVFGVRGCDQQASYLVECNHDYSDAQPLGMGIGEKEWPCQALLNSDSQKNNPTAPSSPEST